MALLIDRHWLCEESWAAADGKTVKRIETAH
jgi:hypothetical protein